MKIYAYLAIFFLVIAAAGTSASYIHKAGYNKREEERKWKATVLAAKAEIIIEERIVEKIREVEKLVPQVVERIVEVTPECADLGDDFAGVLNDQIRAANSVPDPEIANTVVD